MAQTQIKTSIWKLLSCSISSPESAHLCENPLMLSCGHYICKECLQTSVNHLSIKCNTCGKTNEKNLSQMEKQVALFNLFFKENTNELFKYALENFQKTFDTCKEMIYNNEERIDNHLQFIKDAILLRVESVKAEMDNLYDNFSSELDEIGKKWKLKCKEIKFDSFDTKIFESKLKEFEKIANENNTNIKNMENFYEYQKKIKQIQQLIKEYKDKSPCLEFKESEEKITEQLIGELKFVFDDIDQSIIKRIKTNKCEQVNVRYQPGDLCELPNGNLLISSYENANLQLYDANLQPVRTITSINGRSHKIVGIVSDENSNIYMCAYNTRYVIKTDSCFTQLAVFGTGSTQNQVTSPAGLCYYNQSIYVCDRLSKRILKLNSSNLACQKYFQLTEEPWYIKNINNVAILRSSNNEREIYFYDLSTFNMLKKYDGHNGLIGTSKNYFYEYYSSNKTFYCYKNNGELVEQIQINGLENVNDYWSTICVMKEKILIANKTSNHIKII